MSLCWIIVAILALWFLATMIGQFFPRHPLRRFVLVRALLPVWRLFAPEPADRDFHLLVRIWQSEDLCSEWIEIPLISQHTLAKSFFNPSRYGEKTLLTLCTALIGEYLREGEFTLSQPYREMLRFAISRAPAGGHSLQFALVESFGYLPTRDPYLIFASPLEQLPPCN